MHVTLTIRGALEKDAAMQDIVTILYRKAEESRGILEAGEHEPEVPETHKGPSPAYIEAGPDPEPPVEPAEPKQRKAAVANPGFEAAVSDMEQSAPAPKPAKAPAVDFATVAAAARKAMNDGKRDGFAALLKACGAASLAEVAEDELPALLAAIEAL